MRAPDVADVCDTPFSAKAKGASADATGTEKGKRHGQQQYHARSRTGLTERSQILELRRKVGDGLNQAADLIGRITVQVR
jgi:hypothetical protein